MGLVGPDLDDDTVGTIARAFGTWLRGHGATRAVVGADCRLSSPGFREVVIAGLNDTGIDVIDLGMVTTPLTYFALHHLDIGAGIMITGSHNPKEFNGLKMCGQEVRLWRPDSGNPADRGVRTVPAWTRRAPYFDIVPDYMERIVSDCRIRPERRLGRGRCRQRNGRNNGSSIAASSWL